ncbi:hypothetical protein [Vreelandella utahensis]|uniref:hypothetical protein n=1 Tax=Vreelandella halophila TaxID=86177 RepID=UPI0009871E78|nr:hypothetical protein [Halomonas utahensis]
MMTAILRIPLLTTFLALALLALGSSPAHSQQTDGSSEAENESEAMAEQLLDRIHRFRLSNFMALNDYYNYSMDPEEELISEINGNMERSDALLGEIGELAGESLTGSELEDLRSAYTAFQDQMDTNIEDVRGSGYPDLRLLSDMANQAQNLSVLSEEIYNQVAGQETTPTVTDLELAREASITMAMMVTRYSARSSSSVAQVFQGADSEQSLDDLAREFEGNLEELRNRLGDNQAIDATLSDVNSKWRFIRGSYIEYDEKNVAFVINRYSTSIIENLEQAIERLKSA